jgi:ketosteroid isomerase-like protein
MSTRETVQRYYGALAQRQGWEAFLAADLLVTNNGNPAPGREVALAGFRRFFAMVQSIDVRQLLVDGDQAAAMVRYAVQAPNGKAFPSEVAEFFTVNDGAIVAFAICFDTAPYA